MTTTQIAPWAPGGGASAAAGLLQLLGQDVPAGAAPPALRYPANPRDLPHMPEMADQVIRACSERAFYETLASALDREGQVAPSRMINAMPEYKMPGGGGLSWTCPDRTAINRWEGVIVRVKPYRNRWERPRREPSESVEAWRKRPQRLRCASADGQTGYGAPGGDCETCPAAEYESGDDAAYCKKRSRLYVAGLVDGELAVFPLPAMVRQGLQPFVRWAREQGIRVEHLVVRGSLITHERQMGSQTQAKIAIEVTGWARPPDGAAAAEYDAALRLAGQVLSMAEQAWAEGVGAWGDGGDAEYDSDGGDAPRGAQGAPGGYIWPDPAPTPEQAPTEPAPVPTPGHGAEEWEPTRKGDGWNSVRSLLYDEEGYLLRILVKRSDWGYGAQTHDDEGPVSQWANGRTPDEAIQNLLTQHQKGAPEPAPGPERRAPAQGLGDEDLPF